MSVPLLLMQVQQQLSTAEDERNEAMRRVERNTDPAWAETALGAVRETARTRVELTTDDVWARLYYPRERRALGPVMAKAVRQGWIRSTGEVRKSIRPETHANPKAVYESLIFEEYEQGPPLKNVRGLGTTEQRAARWHARVAAQESAKAGGTQGS